MTTLIRGGLIHDAVHRGAYIADILLAGGKIAAIGENLDATADAEGPSLTGMRNRSPVSGSRITRSSSTTYSCSAPSKL